MRYFLDNERGRSYFEFQDGSVKSLSYIVI